MEPVRIEFLMVDKLSQRLDKAEEKIDELKKKTSSANDEMRKLDRSGLSLEGTVKKLAAAFTIKELVGNITKVRGEFQQLEVAFRTMLGSAEKADALLMQLTRTAATTPFGLEDVAQGAKQLLAYGLEAEKVNETLVRLDDIAAGLSIPLGDLVYLYGTTMAQGRLFTQDLNQFTGRGIPMISELAKQFGVAENRVKELVEAGKVGFPEVQAVIESLTDEGGKFGGLMEEQSKTITGQISNIEDAITMMFNEIGQQSEGIINTTLSGVSYMVEHYERFGRILLGLVGTYGVYRTAIMAVVAMKGWATAAEALHYHWLVLVERAQKLLNATMLANPYVLVATLLAGVAVALISMKTETERLQEAEEEYQKQKQKTIEAEEEHLRKMNELCSIAGDEAVATDARREALNQLEQKYPDIFAKYDTEYEKLKNIKQIKEEIAELEGKKSISNPANELAEVEKDIADLEAKKKTERWEDANGSGTRMRKVGGLTSDEEVRLKNLRNKRAELQEAVRKDQVDAYFADLTGISNEDLEAQIRQRKTLLARMEMQGVENGKITYGNELLRGTYSRDELQYQLNKLTSEQNRRNLPTDSSSDWAASAKKKYEEALRAYNDFIQNTTNTLTQEDFEKKAKELKDAADAAKKEYDRVKPGEDKDTEASRKRRERQEKEAEQQRKLSEKLGQELTKLQEANDEADIEAMEDGLQKKLRQIEHEYEARKNEIAQQESDWKRDNRKASGSGELSEEQQSALDTATELNEAKRRRSTAEAYKAEFDAMREHLKQYGTFQQQKLAIAEEYAEKISKAQSEGEKLSLSVERDSRLAGVEAQELRASIDWATVFGEFGGMFSDMVKPVLEDVKKYMQTDEFRNADQDSQQALVEAYRQMMEVTGDVGKTSFKKLGADVTAYQKALQALREAQEEYGTVYAELTAAQQEYARAQAEGTDAEKEAAAQTLEIAQENAAAAQENISTLQEAADTAGQTLRNSATSLKSSMDNVKNGLQQIASGSISGAYEGLISLGKGAKSLEGKLGDAFGKMADKLENVPIIGWIVSIIDIFKDGLSVVVGGLLDAVFNAVSGIIDDVLSGDLFKTIGESLLKGVGKIFDALTFGGFSSWFGSGDSDKTLEEDIEYLTASNEDLKQSIDNLAEKMEDVALQDASGVYEDQKRKLEQSMANTQEMMRRSAAAYSNGFLGIGGSHSSNKKINDAMSDADWDRISAIVGRRIGSASDFWGLSSEEMAKVADEATDLYSKIKSHADDGYKNAAQYMDEYISYYKQLEELQEAYYEKLTGVPFDSLRDSFKNTLLDMSSDAETFAEDLNKTMLDAVIEGMMSGEYTERLREWYKAFAEAMKDGTMTDKEAEALRAGYNSIVEDALEERNALLETLDIDPTEGTEQSAKAGGFTTMTQDQGTKLEGMFTSGLQHWSSMDEKMESVVDKMNTAEGHLARIEENTKASASHLSEIKEEIRKIIRDGLKCK